MKTLHVLNGDATWAGFRTAGLPGEVVVWREMLSEGPVQADVESDDALSALWTMRRNWIQAQFGDRIREEATYDQIVMAEFARIRQFADYDEVVFWFEHDLFCQINLVFLLACLALSDLGRVRLRQVSIDRHPELPDFKGLGQLSGSQLAALYPSAETLTDYERQLALRVWQAYAGPDPQVYASMLSADFGRLKFLKSALLHHLRRFPDSYSGLNAIETQLLVLLKPEPLTAQELVSRFLAQDRVYGIGDWSVEQYIRNLIPDLIRTEDERLMLTEKGEELINNKA